MAEFVLSEFVEPELAAIWDYIALNNIDAADRFLEAAYAAFGKLAAMPGMGRSRRFSYPRLSTARSFRVEGFDNYLVFYAPIPTGIEVLHVLHGARDLEGFFSTPD
jgi:toxin ParE1/3/4